MISELQQEQATLHALGLLDADEAEAVERDLRANPELRDLVRELHDSAASLALLTDREHAEPPPELKARVMQEVAGNRPLASVAAPTAPAGGVEAKVIRPRFGWVPWAIAASLIGCLTALGIRASEEHNLRVKWEGMAKMLRQAKAIEQPMDALSQVAFCELEPTPELAKQPRAAVLWDTANRRGVLRVSKLPPPAAGKDYELWTIEAGRKDAVAAGLVTVDAHGNANLPFQPGVGGTASLTAVAISLEKAGGSPTNEGPILLLGKF